MHVAARETSFVAVEQAQHLTLVNRHSSISSSFSRFSISTAARRQLTDALLIRQKPYLEDQSAFGLLWLV